MSMSSIWLRTGPINAFTRLKCSYRASERDMASSSRLVINHSSADGVNLIQVVSTVTGDSKHAGETCLKAIKTLDIEKKRARIGGVGREVLVGSATDAVRIAEHLKAPEDLVIKIKAYLEATGGIAEGGNGSRESSHPAEMEASTRDLPTIWESIMRSNDEYPVVFDERWSAFMGQRHDHAVASIEKLMANGCLVQNKHYKPEEYLNPQSGKKWTRYRFTRQGIKSVLMAGRTATCRQFRQLLSEILDSRVMAEVLDTQKKQKAPVYTAFLEHRIRDRMAKILGARVEVECEFGKVDVLTDSHVIEIKKVCAYKSAIGQVMAYKQCFPGRSMRVHLFGKESEMRLFKKANKACKALNIEVTWEFIS